MYNINYKILEPGQIYQKNTLYRINVGGTVQFKEEHETHREIVDLEYCLNEQQYGIFAFEYRSPSILKEGSKSADILAGIIDEADKKIYTMIFDVKSNISAFSDDLYKDNAMITAIKEVKDFIEQIHAEILHKNSFLLYYKDDGYEEEEKIGIVTRNFEKEKFLLVAEEAERLATSNSIKISPLVSLKVQNNLRPYMNEIEKIRDFGKGRVKISGKIYELNIFLLNQINESDHWISIKVA